MLMDHRSDRTVKVQLSVRHKAALIFQDNQFTDVNKEAKTQCKQWNQVHLLYTMDMGQTKTILHDCT